MQCKCNAALSYAISKLVKVPNLSSRVLAMRISHGSNFLKTSTKWQKIQILLYPHNDYRIKFKSKKIFYTRYIYFLRFIRNNIWQNSRTIVYFIIYYDFLLISMNIICIFVIKTLLILDCADVNI